MGSVYARNCMLGYILEIWHERSGYAHHHDLMLYLSDPRLLVHMEDFQCMCEINLNMCWESIRLFRATSIYKSNLLAKESQSWAVLSSRIKSNSDKNLATDNSEKLLDDHATLMGISNA